MYVNIYMNVCMSVCMHVYIHMYIYFKQETRRGRKTVQNYETNERKQRQGIHEHVCINLPMHSQS